MKRPVLTIIAVLLFSLVSTITASGYTNVSVGEAKTMIDSTPSLVVLDVRTQSEYDSGHIRNTMYIPLAELGGRLDELNETDSILVYCASGGRSASASQLLVDNGFLHIYNMLEGITAWISAGYPVYIKYSSIQEAINNASPGDTILVSSGIYYENVVVNKTLSLIGEAKEGTIIDGNQTGVVVEITADSVRLGEFTMRNGGDDYAGIVLSSNGSNIVNNIIFGNHYGIILFHSSNNSFFENSVLDNYCGITLSNSSHNIFSENFIQTNQVHGIALAESMENQIRNNSITANGDKGISMTFGSSNNLVQDNDITSNSNVGVGLDTASQGNLIVTNTITGNLDEGVYISESSDDNRIISNLIRDNGEGVNINILSWNITVVGNVIAQNGIGVYISNSWGRLYHNNFVNNTIQAYTYESSSYWDNGCEGNFWSNYNGTDLDGDGIGDTYLLWEGVDNYPLMNLYWTPGDIDHDLDVDIFDAVRCGIAYGSTPSDPNWNPHCDIAKPFEVINIFDIVMIATSYGEEYTS